MESDKKKSRVRLFLSACMISCASLRMKDSQGCTADVKDTPPSPKEKPGDLIGPDIDPVGDHDDQMTERNRLSIQSFDSGVSFKSNWSKDVLIDYKEGVSPSRLDLSSFEKKHDVADDGFFDSADNQWGFSSPEEDDVSDDEDLVESSDDLMVKRMLKSSDSGVSLKSDQSKAEPTDFKDRVSPSGLDFSSSEKKHVVTDDGFGFYIWTDGT